MTQLDTAIERLTLRRGFTRLREAGGPQAERRAERAPAERGRRLGVHSSGINKSTWSNPRLMEVDRLELLRRKSWEPV